MVLIIQSIFNEQSEKMGRLTRLFVRFILRHFFSLIELGECDPRGLFVYVEYIMLHPICIYDIVRSSP